MKTDFSWCPFIKNKKDRDGSNQGNTFSAFPIGGKTKGIRFVKRLFFEAIVFMFIFKGLGFMGRFQRV